MSKQASISKRVFRQFIGYIKRVYHFGSVVKGMDDDRRWKKVSSKNVFITLFFCIILRWGSLRRAHMEVQEGRLDKFFLKDGRGRFSLNEIGYVAQRLSLHHIKKSVVRMVKKMRRNKVFLKGVIPGKIAVALDGRETIKSYAVHCDECLTRRVRKGEKDLVQYYHRSVIAQIVGCDVKPIIWIEQQRHTEKGEEGEQSAARRTVREIGRYYGKGFVGVYLVDALNFNEPFIREALNQGADVIGKLKENHSRIIQEIEGLSKLVDPIVWYDEYGLPHKAWDIEEIDKSLALSYPLRGIKIWEIVRVEKEGKIQWCERVRYCGTTIPKSRATAKQINRLLWQEWEVENNGHRDQKSNWHLRHNFHHHPRAIEVIQWIMVMAFNLFWAFVKLNLKLYRIYGYTQQKVVDLLREGFPLFEHRRRGSSIWDTS